MFACGDAEVADPPAILEFADLRVSSQVTDQDGLIETAYDERFILVCIRTLSNIWGILVIVNEKGALTERPQSGP